MDSSEPRKCKIWKASFQKKEIKTLDILEALSHISHYEIGEGRGGGGSTFMKPISHFYSFQVQNILILLPDNRVCFKQ